MSDLVPWARYIQDNYLKLQAVERELEALRLEVKLTSGSKKAGAPGPWLPTHLWSGAHLHRRTSQALALAAVPCPTALPYGQQRWS